MKLDLHVHTRERSSCAHASEVEQIQAAIAAGLDAIFITDHWSLVPAEHLEELNNRYDPFRIFAGIEVSADGEDLLVLGIQDHTLETQPWSYPDLHAFVRQRGGFIVLAHPFRFHTTINLDLQSCLPDAIEVYSSNTPLAAETDIRQVAKSLSIPLLSDSDAHTTDRLGTYYNILPDGAVEMQSIFRLLRQGDFSLYKK